MRSILSQSGFIFESKYCKVVSGVEESTLLWTWINLIRKPEVNSDSNRVCGVMDLSLSSLELSFNIEIPDLVLKNIYQFKFGDANINLY